MASITRRTLLAGAACAAGVGLLPRSAEAFPLNIAPGLQLWTVKEELARDFAGTLRALKEIGYSRVEAAGWQGRSARDFRAAIDDAGLECVSCHYSLGDLIADTETCLATARDVGVRHCVASSPAPSRPLPPGKPWATALVEAMTLDDWRSNAEAMNRIGERARAMGMRFGYHNHSAEFLAYDGNQAFEEIVRLTDPTLVDLELDIGWVAAAGVDPAEVIRRYAPRIRLLHVKDIATRERTPGRIADDLRTVPIGRGTVDWPAVFEAARSAPIASYFVEQEPPFVEPPLAGLRASLAYLSGLSS